MNIIYWIAVAWGTFGQSCVYNTYATPPTKNPLFQGFSRSQNVNKEIINLILLKNIKSPKFWGFFCIYYFKDAVYAIWAKVLDI